MVAEGELKWVSHNMIPLHWALRMERWQEGLRKEAAQTAADLSSSFLP